MASAILVSGGHVRGNFNEAAWMARALQVIGERLHVDLRDRVLLEPCAAATSSNLRNSLKMVEAMQLERALLVTEGRALPAQSSRFDNMDGLALSDLDCHVGTVSRLRGPASTRFAGMLYLITALDSEESKSKFYGTGRASLFLVRPHGRLPDGRTSSTSECRGGRPDSVRANKVQQPSDCQVAGQPVVGNCAVPADTIKLGRR